MLSHLLGLMHRSTLEGLGEAHKQRLNPDSFRMRHKRHVRSVRSTSRA